ncbi:hypothetical protein CI102_12163 [Trichoderma harzianum]|uniref:Uncharacterized protein n=1 Tax=Trichoderma harzianum CBS 226.95 TaxID=983964 RepID=A0A2T3ZRU6_TRIHA|nr:hypothetical protein M431DRAFT_396645 [Trichoderma harzianum CBS 226.95]PKK43246.1 hypothetical protein CI102_12163 [Trichoderma harzianum]PTB47498.1 hypothetical protein M431DRAFT_396645 [Trichoderma harzianum CBS 226.95]
MNFFEYLKLLDLFADLSNHALICCRQRCKRTIFVVRERLTNLAYHGFPLSERAELTKLLDTIDLENSDKLGLRAPNIDCKAVLNVDSLRVILTFNIADDAGTFDLEQYRIHLAGCYQILCSTRARPAELVDGERKKPKDGSFKKLFLQKVVDSADDNSDDVTDTLDEESWKIKELLSMETTKHG